MLSHNAARMKAHECYHCKQWVEEDEAHDRDEVEPPLTDWLREAYRLSASSDRKGKEGDETHE